MTAVAEKMDTVYITWFCIHETKLFDEETVLSATDIIVKISEAFSRKHEHTDWENLQWEETIEQFTRETLKNLDKDYL